MMKKLFLFSILLFCGVCLFAQDGVNTTGSFIQNNWMPLLIGLLGLLEVIVKLTPTKKDDGVLIWVKKLIDLFIPNIKKGGGTHDKNMFVGKDDWLPPPLKQ